MQKITVNKNKVFEIDFKGDKILSNNNIFEWDIVEIKPTIFHIIKNGKSYNAEILNTDFENKTLTIAINGNKYTITAEDEFDLLLKKMGMANAATLAPAQLKAPMPGLIVEIKVKEGDEVKKGDSLLILEAMKMENILKAPADAVIKSIKAEKGKTVDKGEVLMMF